MTQRVGLRSVLEKFGAQCVMTTGELMMRKWSADNWDMLHMVRNSLRTKDNHDNCYTMQELWQ